MSRDFTIDSLSSLFLIIISGVAEKFFQISIPCSKLLRTALRLSSISAALIAFTSLSAVFKCSKYAFFLSVQSFIDPSSVTPATKREISSPNFSLMSFSEYSVSSTTSCNIPAITTDSEYPADERINPTESG